MNKALASLLCALACASAHADSAAPGAALAERAQALAVQAAQAGAAQGLRVEVTLGRLDPRLKLAPCTQVQPWLPAGTRLWGPARIGLRCIDASVKWNVWLPVTVEVFGPALVAASALPAGHVLGAADLQRAEVRLTAQPSPAIAQAALAEGRALARAVSAGEALREADLRARQWFAAGDTVRIVAAGAGWRVAAEGQALGAGVEGRSVRVRTESGRVVAGMPVADRLVEVAL